MKSARFHMKYTPYLAFSGRGVLGEIHQISHEIWQISWPYNLPDSTTMKSGRFHMKYTAYLAFSGRPWNQPDSTWNTLHI